MKKTLSKIRQNLNKLDSQRGLVESRIARRLSKPFIETIN